MLQSSLCRPIVEQGCSTLDEIANHLLCKAYEALNSCFVGGSCEGEVAAYVTSGQGDDGVTDKLTVAVLQMTPSVLTVETGPGMYRALFEVRLHESGWPTVRNENGTIIPPPPEEQALASSQLLAHGEAIHRRLTHLRATKKIAPPTLPMLNSLVGDMVPVFPQGGVAGWTVNVTIQLPWGM